MLPSCQHPAGKHAHGCFKSVERVFKDQDATVAPCLHVERPAHVLHHRVTATARNLLFATFS